MNDETRETITAMLVFLVSFMTIAVLMEVMWGWQLSGDAPWDWGEFGTTITYQLRIALSAAVFHGALIGMMNKRSGKAEPSGPSVSVWSALCAVGLMLVPAVPAMIEGLSGTGAVMIYLTLPLVLAVVGTGVVVVLGAAIGRSFAKRSG